MLQFKDVAPRENTLKSIGTVGKFIGENGYYELSSMTNFTGKLNEETGELTRITVVLVNSNGQKAWVNCSDKLSKELRSLKKTSIADFEAKWNSLGTLPILELPQFDKTGSPIMDVDPDTGELVQRVIYSISNEGGVDMSATRVTIDKSMINAKPVARVVDWNDIIAL